MKDRYYNARRRSPSEDSYDHLRRYQRNSGEFYGRGRSPSLDRDPIYSRVRRRSISPEEYYGRGRRYSFEGPPSGYFTRGRRFSDDYGFGRFRRHSADFGRRRRYSDDYSYLPPRRNSVDSYVPVDRRIRRYHSDPYIDRMSYGQVMPLRTTARPAYTVLTQPAYGRMAPAYTRVVAPMRSAYSGVNYVRRPVPIEYIDTPAPPVRYIQQRQIAPPVQYVQRPLPPPVQYIEPPVAPPVRYVTTQRSMVRPVEYVERPQIVQNVVEQPIVARRYQIEGDLTPIETGPGTFHVKYDNVKTKFDVMPMRNEVRGVTNYESQPITAGQAYTAYYLGKGGGTAEGYGGYQYSSNYSSRNVTDGSRGKHKELDHVLYHGNGKMTKVFEESDFNNNNKARIIR